MANAILDLHHRSESYLCQANERRVKYVVEVGPFPNRSISVGVCNDSTQSLETRWKAPNIS